MIGSTRFVAPKPLFWSLFGLLTVSAVIGTSLPILQPSHPLHALLYAQRWLLFPHIAAGATALVLGPLQFSRRLRERDPARHRRLGQWYVGACLVAAALAPAMAWHYPAFFPYSVTINATLWIANTVAAYVTARKRRIEQHRRWMARSYAMASTFVLARIPLPIAAYENMSVEASSYFLLVVTLTALLAADLIVDWDVLHRPARPAARASTPVH